MKVFKGGYKIVSLLNIDITSDFTISGIYDDIKDSHGKPILVSEINVGGEKMNDAYTIVKQDNTDYIIEVYGYSLTIASDDSVTVAEVGTVTSIGGVSGDITLGSGLAITEDGELSASGGSGKIYYHKYTLKETSDSGLTSFRINVSLYSSSGTAYTTVKDIVTSFMNSDDTSSVFTALGYEGASGSTQYIIDGIQYYTSTNTKFQYLKWIGNARTSVDVDFTKAQIQNSRVVEV